MPTRQVALELHTICDGQLCVNVTHWQGDQANTDHFQIAKALVEAVDGTTANAGFTAVEYMVSMSTSCFLSALVARVVSNGGGPRYPKLYPSDVFTGQVGDDLYSQSLAANIKFITSSDPDYTGRMFYPGIPEESIEANRWTSAFETQMNSLNAALASGIEALGITWDQVVWSKKTQLAEVINHRTLVPNPGTIRRRLSPY
jgi:hypothetical protein